MARIRNRIAPGKNEELSVRFGRAVRETFGDGPISLREIEIAIGAIAAAYIGQIPDRSERAAWLQRHMRLLRRQVKAEIPDEWTPPTKPERR